MREFFRGWKRKLGVVTLLMACLFAAGWVRSYGPYDQISFIIFGRLVQCGSATGDLRWATWWDKQIPQSFEWEYNTFYSHSSRQNTSNASSNAISVVRYIAGKDQAQNGPYGSAGAFRWSYIPYWSIVIPLTLVSAWLLLSKPRVKREKENK